MRDYQLECEREEAEHEYIEQYVRDMHNIRVATFADTDYVELAEELVKDDVANAIIAKLRLVGERNEHGDDPGSLLSEIGLIVVNAAYDATRHDVITDAGQSWDNKQNGM